MTTKISVPVLEIEDIATWLASNPNDLLTYVNSLTGTVTTPIDPTDVGKVWTAGSGGTTSWEPSVGSIPTPVVPGDNDKIIRSVAGVTTWDTERTPKPVDPTDDNKFLKADNGTATWQKVFPDPDLNAYRAKGRVLTYRANSAVNATEWRSPEWRLVFGKELDANTNLKQIFIDGVGGFPYIQGGITRSGVPTSIPHGSIKVVWNGLMGAKASTAYSFLNMHFWGANASRANFSIGILPHRDHPNGPLQSGEMTLTPVSSNWGGVGQWAYTYSLMGYPSTAGGAYATSIAWFYTDITSPLEGIQLISNDVANPIARGSIMVYVRDWTGYTYDNSPST